MTSTSVIQFVVTKFGTAMASSCGIVVASQSGLVSNHWNPPLMLPTSDSLRVRASCANATSSSPSSTAASGSEILTWPLRLRKRGCVFRQTRRRNKVQVAAEDGEGEEPRETVSQRWSLDELDQQLKLLSNREVSAPRQTPIPRQSLGDPERQQNTVNGSSSPLQWPNLTTGFFVYAGVGLLLLTIVNNVLFKIFLGSPGVDRKNPLNTSVPVAPRFRVTSLQEEREAREAKDAQEEAIAAQSKDAPLPLE